MATELRTRFSYNSPSKEQSQLLSTNTKLHSELQGQQNQHKGEEDERVRKREDEERREERGQGTEESPYVLFGAGGTDRSTYDYRGSVSQQTNIPSTGITGSRETAGKGGEMQHDTTDILKECQIDFRIRDRQETGHPTGTWSHEEPQEGGRHTSEEESASVVTRRGGQSGARNSDTGEESLQDRTRAGSKSSRSGRGETCDRRGRPVEGGAPNQQDGGDDGANGRVNAVELGLGRWVASLTAGQRLVSAPEHKALLAGLQGRLHGMRRSAINLRLQAGHSAEQVREATLHATNQALYNYVGRSQSGAQAQKRAKKTCSPPG